MQQLNFIIRCLVPWQILLRAPTPGSWFWQGCHILQTDMSNIISHYCPVGLLLSKSNIDMIIITESNCFIRMIKNKFLKPNNYHTVIKY